MTNDPSDTPAVLTREFVESVIFSCDIGGPNGVVSFINDKPLLAAICRSWLARQDEARGWQPISTCPSGALVLLANMNRNRSDDTLGFCKDIGYLTEGGWFSTFGEHRGQTKEAFTHWKADAALQEKPHD